MLVRVYALALGEWQKIELKEEKRRCCLQVPLGHGILVENYRWWECSIYQAAFHFFGYFSGEFFWVHGSTSYWKVSEIKTMDIIFILDTRWWQLKYFWNVHPETMGFHDVSWWRSPYFFNGLVTNHQLVTPLAAWAVAFVNSQTHPATKSKILMKG